MWYIVNRVACEYIPTSFTYLDISRTWLLNEELLARTIFNQCGEGKKYFFHILSVHVYTVYIQEGDKLKENEHKVS